MLLIQNENCMNVVKSGTVTEKMICESNIYMLSATEINTISSSSSSELYSFMKWRFKEDRFFRSSLEESLGAE